MIDICTYEQIGESGPPFSYKCSGCGHERRSAYTADKLHRNCHSTKRRPGNRLHEILRERFKLDITEGCGCRKQINRMNAWGPKGCRENLDEIVAGMLTEARDRKWQIDGRPLLTALARIGTLTPFGVAFARGWARRLILEAVADCERGG